MSRARTVRVSVDPLNLSPASLFYARGLLLRNYPRFWKKLGSLPTRHVPRCQSGIASDAPSFFGISYAYGITVF